MVAEKQAAAVRAYFAFVERSCTVRRTQRLQMVLQLERVEYRGASG